MNPKYFHIKIQELQPSQLYICKEKYEKVMENIPIGKITYEIYEPIPIKVINGENILLDGHTRTFWFSENNVDIIKVYWEFEEINMDIYSKCIEWCKEENIRNISDLKNRIILKDEYKIKWIKRCESIL
jgi:hypothetical protein